MSISDKNILFLTSAVEGGGLENRFRRLMPNLLPTAGSRHLVCLTNINTDMCLNGLAVRSLYYRGPLDYPSAIRNLTKILREEDIDMVYAISRCANVVAYFACRRVKKPIKLVVGVAGRKGKAYDLRPTLRGWFWQKVSTFIFNRADMVMCNSHAARDELTGRFGVNHASIRVLPNPVPQASASAHCTDDADALPKPFILGAGRLVEDKGWEDMLQAFAAIRDRVEDHLVIAGVGPLDDALRGLVDQLDLAERVHFAGWVDDLYHYYAQCKMFVSASYTEGMPNAILEAMSAGAPVISAESTSWIPIFAEQGGCICVKPGDITGLGEAMVNLSVSEETRNTLSEGGRQIVAEFSLEKVARKYDEVLERVISESD